MIHLTSKEHEELLRARAERDELRRVLAAHGGKAQILNASELHLVAQMLILSAHDSDLVLTIEQVPSVPLAMGNYTSVASVRAARVRADVQAKAPTP